VCFSSLYRISSIVAYRCSLWLVLQFSAFCAKVLQCHYRNTWQSFGFLQCEEWVRSNISEELHNYLISSKEKWQDVWKQVLHILSNSSLIVNLPITATYLMHFNRLCYKIQELICFPMHYCYSCGTQSYAVPAFFQITKHLIKNSVLVVIAYQLICQVFLIWKV
jgi:hypothetical protein